MRTIHEQHREATAGSLARTLYPDTDGRAATGVARRGQDGALARLLCGMATRVAAFRERRAVTEDLSRMSDHELADIGLSRGQLRRVFDPEFARATSILHRTEDEPGEQVLLVELGLTPPPARPLAGC